MDENIRRMLPEHVDPATTLYVADRDLNIVYTNDEWTHFAAQNGGDLLLGAHWKTNVLDNFSGNQRVRWTSLYRLLLEGRLPFHEEDFICSSPTERRIYRLRITPERDENGDVGWLIHHSVLVDHERQHQETLRRRLEQLDQDPQAVCRQYREQVVLRKIRVPRYRVTQHLVPLDDVGGDVLWHMEHAGGVTDVVHADIAGHGQQAGSHAAKITLILDSVAKQANVTEVVSSLNSAMIEHNSDSLTIFATGLYFRFHADEQRLTCANFGHLGPIFSLSGMIQLESGLPVGVVEQTDPWPLTEIDLSEHGHRFLVYSDGITEQFNMDGEMFGADRLLQSYLRRLDRPLDTMLTQIIEDLAQFRGNAIVKDDQTLLAMEFVTDG
jgi:serine phosphatase RsbU (regulator of sigma subunit)